MKIEIVYLRICAAIVLSLILIFAVAAPLFGSSTDVGVLLALVICVFVPIMDLWLLRPVYNHFKEKYFPENEEK